MTPPRLALALALPLSLIACGGGDDGSGGGPLTLTPELQKGPYDMVGTISLTMPLPAGTRVSLMLTDATGGVATRKLTSANAIENHSLGGARTELGFAVRGVKAGKYLFGVAADTSRDGAIGEGDVAGFYGGSAASPALYGKDAQVLTVTSASLADLSFGIGPVTCKAKVGQSCAADDDCRGTVCTSGGVKSGLTNGACDPSARTCRLSSCAPLGGGATASEGGCFGGL